MRRDPELPALDLLEQVRHAGVIEGQSTAEEGIEDDTTAPDVNFRTSVQLYVRT